MPDHSSAQIAVQPSVGRSVRDFGKDVLRYAEGAALVVLAVEAVVGQRLDPDARFVLGLVATMSVLQTALGRGVRLMRGRL